MKVFPPKFAIWPHPTIRHKSVDITRHQKSDCFAPTAQRNRTMIISKNSLKMSFLLYCQEWMNKPFLMKNSLTLGSSRNISYSSARCLVGILMNSWHPIISSKQLHLSSQQKERLYFSGILSNCWEIPNCHNNLFYFCSFKFFPQPSF